MAGIFDLLRPHRNRAREAGTQAAGALRSEVARRLLEGLDYLDDRRPDAALAAGAGSHEVAAVLARRWPRALVLTLEPTPRPPPRRRLRGPAWAHVAGEVAALPLAEASLDLVVWHLGPEPGESLAASLAGLRRVLRPDGLLLCWCFGPDTLGELEQAGAEAGCRLPSPRLPAIQQLGDALLAAGFRDPVLDREHLRLTHEDLRALLHARRAAGLAVPASPRRPGLAGTGALARLSRACERWRRPEGLVSTWEVIYAQAWGPRPGAPRRERGMDVASVPLAQIPIRRRGR